MTNHLYYGDNLQVLRECIATESVDLVYLDPPFNSQATYNVLFRSPGGEQSQAQIEAFEDTWHWNAAAERAFDEVMQSGNTDAAEMLRAMRSFLRENDLMAYLTMMAVRLLELHRVLKSTGSLFLHCDPSASHYLKILLDAIFKFRNFKNEITWKRTSAHNDAKRFGANADIIFLYTKSEIYTFNPVYQAYSEEYKARFRNADSDGRRWADFDLTGAGAGPARVFADRGEIAPKPGRHWMYDQSGIDRLISENRIHWTKSNLPRLKIYLNDLPGMPCQAIWDDISPINSQAQERLGYPTQKPLALLERILKASSNENDVVLDSFCGCGTTIHAAQKLERQWIGIDITHLAISLIEKRLKDAFPGIQYEVHGTPKDLAGARDLAARDKYQFQWWAVSLINAVPYGGKKKGADTGIDGLIYFKPEAKKTEKAIVSVKGGENVSVAMIRDLGHVVEREQAKMGIFITLAEPTKPMQTEAVKAGFYETDYGKYPKLQIFTIEELLSGKKPQLPLLDPTAFKKAAKEDLSSSKQTDLDL